MYPLSAGIPGPRDPGLTPYIIPFERFFEDHRYETCVLVCSTQSGKTDSVIDVMGWRLDTRPRPQLYVGPSKDFVTDQFEPRLMKLFDEAPTLAALVARGKRNKKVRKTVNGVSVRLAWAGSATSLSSDQAGDVYIDEYDKMVGGVKGEGDPFTLAKARADTYADRKIAVTSTPKRGQVVTERDETTGLEFWQVAKPEDLESPIWVKWQSGTRHHWSWQCPHCDEWFIPRLRELKYPDGATPAEARRSTWLRCPRNGCVIEESHRPAMNASGLYVAPGQRIEDGVVVGDAPDSMILSLFVSGLASPFVHWGERVEEIMLAEASGDDEARQGAVNKAGEVWSPAGAGAAQWQQVAEHCSVYQKGDLPAGVVYLALTVDVQANRLPWVIRGWGARATSWLIDYGTLYGETVEEPVWDELADLLNEPVCGVPIRVALVDSGFRPGKPITLPLNRVYEFCRRFPRAVRATKGSSVPLRIPLVVSKHEVTTAGAASKYGLELLRLDTDHWKSWVHERLMWPPDKPGSWNLPTPCNDEERRLFDDYCKQVVAEVRVISDGKPKWIVRTRENHALDLEAMSAAAGYLMNMQRMTEDMAVRLIRQRENLKVTSEQLPEAAVIAKPAGLRALSQLNRPRVQ